MFTDVIYIGTIHPEHLKLGKLALDNGKHVLCEKPLCMNVKETIELIQHAKSKRLFFMEAIWSRFFPAYLKLKEEIDNGSIGEVLQVIVGMGLQFPEDNWRRYVEKINLTLPLEHLEFIEKKRSNSSRP